MSYDPERHHRRSIRLEAYDYTRSGAYFVTACVQDRVCLFGEVVDGKMELNSFGEVVAEHREWLEQQYAHVQLDAWVVMPNHLHGIIVLMDDNPCRGGFPAFGGELRLRTAPTPAKRKPLGRLVGAFKTVSTKHINRMWNCPSQRLWQRNFYEHVTATKKNCTASANTLRRIRRGGI